jgi:hypothetical protein
MTKKRKISDVVQGGQGRTSDEAIQDSLIVLFAIIAAGSLAIFAITQFTHRMEETPSVQNIVISR